MRRKHYFINTGMQSRYMGMVALLILIISFTTGWVVYSTIWDYLHEALEGEPGLDRMLVEMNTVLLGRISLLILAGMCVSAVITMFITHRIAGPMLRLKRVINEMAEGETPGIITLRKKDEFREIALSLNALISRISRLEAGQEPDRCRASDNRENLENA